MKILEKWKHAGRRQFPAPGKDGKRPSKTLHLIRKRKWLWIILLAVVVILGILGYRYYSLRKARQAMAEAMRTIETVRVTRQDLIDSISVTGTIASADAWDVSASAKDVEVLQVNYEVGDYVNKGDVIAVLDSADLERSLNQAKNSQALSEYKENKSIETASTSYEEAVEDGTSDYQKAVKNEAEAKEALQEAEADLEEAVDALKRQEERVTEADEALAAISPEDYEGGADSEEYKNAVASAQQALSEAQLEYTSRHQTYNSLSEAEEKALDAYETAAENLEDARTQNDRNIASAANSLEQAQMEHTYSNDSSQQTIENYQEQIDSCTVTSPISGVITAMNVDVGDTYQGEGTALFSVADNEHFIVSASVDEYDISSISKDMTAAVIVEAIGDEELPATVSFVSPTVSSSNTGNSSYAIEISLDEANTDLRIGMTAKASIVLKASYDVLTVPYDCVETDEDGSPVVYVDQNGEKTAVPVTLGMESDYYVEVSGDGLDENTMVYYSTPMINEASSGNASDDGSGALQVEMNDGGGDMPGGGNMPGGGDGGGMPGGGNSGGRGGAAGGF